MNTSRRKGRKSLSLYIDYSHHHHQHILPWIYLHFTHTYCCDIKISVDYVTTFSYICSFTHSLITEIATICLSKVKLGGRLEISWRHVFVCCRFRLFQAINNRSAAVQVPHSEIVNYHHPLRRDAIYSSIRVRSSPATHFIVK